MGACAAAAPNCSRARRWRGCRCSWHFRRRRPPRPLCGGACSRRSGESASTSRPTTSLRGHCPRAASSRARRSVRTLSAVRRAAAPAPARATGWARRRPASSRATRSSRCAPARRTRRGAGGATCPPTGAHRHRAPARRRATPAPAPRRADSHTQTRAAPFRSRWSRRVGQWLCPCTIARCRTSATGSRRRATRRSGTLDHSRPLRQRVSGGARCASVRRARAPRLRRSFRGWRGSRRRRPRRGRCLQSCVAVPVARPSRARW